MLSSRDDPRTTFHRSGALIVALVATTVVPAGALAASRERVLVSTIQTESMLQRHADRVREVIKEELGRRGRIAVTAGTAAQTIGGALTYEGDVYVLTLTLATSGESGSAKATEQMHLLKNIPMNVKLCLDRLLPDAAPAEATTAEKPSAEEAAPPIVGARQTRKESAEKPPQDEAVPATSGGRQSRKGAHEPHEPPVLAVLAVKAGPGFIDEDVTSLDSVLLSALDGTKRFRLIAHANSGTLLDVITGTTKVDYIAETEMGRVELGRADHGYVLSLRVVDVHRGAVAMHAERVVPSVTELSNAMDDLADQVASTIFGIPRQIKPAPAPPPPPISAAP